jgi:hypothetical protein
MSATGLPQHSRTLSPTVVADSGSFLHDLMAEKPDKFKAILNSPDKFEVQIIYTQIDRDAKNAPSFTQHSFGVSSRSYFNPASTVKFPLICLSLEKLNKLKIEGLNKNTRFAITQEHGCNTAITRDATARSGFPSIAHLTSKMLLVSDNEAYNQMFEFLGQKEINERLWNMGYRNTLIIRRFSLCSWEDNRYTNPIVFFNDDGTVIYRQPSVYNPIAYSSPLGRVLKGVRYMNELGAFIDGPFDYTYSNCLSLQDINDMVKSVFFPIAVSPEKRFNLTQDDRTLIYKYMSMLPRESKYPDYSNDMLLTDNYKKYLLFGDRYGYDLRISNSPIRIFNIVGKADGFLTDVSYIADFDAKIEFMLSAVIYSNEGNVIRDGTYEYYTVGLPFLGELGRTIYDFEKARHRKHAPDLSRFKIDYSN